MRLAKVEDILSSSLHSLRLQSILPFWRDLDLGVLFDPSVLYVALGEARNFFFVENYYNLLFLRSDAKIS